MSQDLFLNIADIRHRSSVNGPGLRAVVWVQGCTLGCKGCFNPHTHPHEPRKLLDPAELGRNIVALSDIEGLTISGGEPFQQARACATLAETVRASGKSVMVFTGYPFGMLKHSKLPEVQRFLKAIDLLIAGPYLPEMKADGRHWLGSLNQTIHFLTDRLKPAAEALPLEAPVMEIASDGHHLVGSGFPDQKDFQWLSRLPFLEKPTRSK